MGNKMNKMHSLKERLINAFGCAEMVAGSPLWAAHQVF
jgi:hypothetical protein